MHFAVGDVIKTHPRDGFWGCAVVLSLGGIEGLDPLCHIGVTPVVFRHDYAWDELDATSLSILVVDRSVRMAPDTYGTRPRVTCIGIYTTKAHPKCR